VRRQCVERLLPWLILLIGGCIQVVQQISARVPHAAEATDPLPAPRWGAFAARRRAASKEPRAPHKQPQRPSHQAEICPVRQCTYPHLPAKNHKRKPSASTVGGPCNLTLTWEIYKPFGLKTSPFSHAAWTSIHPDTPSLTCSPLRHCECERHDGPPLPFWVHD
jgi:hypothetical protein